MESQKNLEYKKLIDTAMLAGTLLIASGAETYRVEDTTKRMLSTTGFEIAESFVLPTGITLTLSNELDCTYSITKRINIGASNMNRIVMVNNISREFCAGNITLDEAHDMLKEIEHKHIYSKMLKVFGCSLGGAGFAIMFGGDIFDGLVAFICSFVIGLAMYYLSRVMRKDIFVFMFCAAILCIMASGISLFAEKYMPFLNLSPQYIIAGSIMTLVPGLTLTNAIRDLLKGDYLSACARFVGALTTAVAIALGALAGLYLTHVMGMRGNELGFIIESQREPLYEIFCGILSSYIAMIGFSIIYEIPKKFFFIAPLIGSIAWLTYSGFVLFNTSNVIACLVAAAIAELCSYILARVLKAPVTLFLVIGIIPLVPGFYIYRASYYLLTDSNGALSSLITTLLLAGGIALGIILMDMVIETIMKIIQRTKKKQN